MGASICLKAPHPRFHVGQASPITVMGSFPSLASVQGSATEVSPGTEEAYREDTTHFVY